MAVTILWGRVGRSRRASLHLITGRLFLCALRGLANCASAGCRLLTARYNKLKVLKRRCYGLRNVVHLFQRLTLDLDGYRRFSPWRVPRYSGVSGNS